MREAFCQLLRLPDVSKLTILKLREMDVELAPAGEGGIIPVGPFGYVPPGTSEFVYARRAVLKSLIAALLVALNTDRQAQALAPVAAVDYGAYGTNAADFETAVFSLLSYAMASTGEGLLVGARSEIKELRDLVHKERLRERTLTQKGIGNQMIVKLISVLFIKTQYMVAYSQVTNSIGCGHLLPSIRSKYFPICARTTPESLNPFGDTRNAVLGKNVYDTCVRLLSPYACLYCLSYFCLTGYAKKTDGSGSVDTTPERRAPKTPYQAYKQTRLFLFTMVLLAQDTVVVTSTGATVGWLTLLPVFAYMEALLSIMTHEGMTLKGFVLFRDESFRMIRDLVNVAGSDRTLDSALLEVSKSTDSILRQFRVAQAFNYGDKTKATEDRKTDPIGEDTSGENSTDSTVFTAHQAKTLQDKIDELEKEDSKKNSVINRLIEEKRDLQRKLTEANRRLADRDGDGLFGKRSRESSDETHRSKQRSHSRERSRGRSGSRSSKVTYGEGGGNKRHGK